MSKVDKLLKIKGSKIKIHSSKCLLCTVLQQRVRDHGKETDLILGLVLELVQEQEGLQVQEDLLVREVEERDIILD